MDNSFCDSILEWNDDFGHAYFWSWVDDIFREQVIHYLLDSDKRQTDYAGKDMLRWLFTRWRKAQRRLKPKDMPDDFRAYRWSWSTPAEVTADTFLSEHRIRRAVHRTRCVRPVVSTWRDFGHAALQLRLREVCFGAPE